MQTIELRSISVPVRLPSVKAKLGLNKRTGSALEASAANLGNLVAHANHPLVHAIDTAYSTHLPLTLSPDDIWLCITQAFALHVNLHAETLRKRLVGHEGQALITVVRDGFTEFSPAKDWPGVFAEFADRLAQELGAVSDLLLADFSTTGPIEKGVSQIVLMSAMQAYFRYDLEYICGIPRITLLGTPHDWQAIRRRAESLADYELQEWMRPLLTVLDHFVAASTGHADKEFWTSIFTLNPRECGLPPITGWINSLFPYIKCVGSASSGELMQNPFVGSWQSDLTDLDRGRLPGPAQSQFPWGLSRAPFTFTYLGPRRSMQFLGGFVGVSQDPETAAVRAAIGWAVHEIVDVSLVPA